MICTVVPLRPEMMTRTTRKPRSLRVGSTSAAISPATPVSLKMRASDTAPLTLSLTCRASLEMALSAQEVNPKEKERTRRAHSQS